MFDILNRDYSWLKFNERVLEETTRISYPLQERVIYHGITHSNLDEFIQTRYPATIDMYDEDGLKEFRKTIQDHYKLLERGWEECNDRYELLLTSIYMGSQNRNWMRNYFRKNIYPTLQPVTLSNAKVLDPRTTITIFVVTSDDKDRVYLNYVEIPHMLPRFIITPDGKHVVPIEVFVTSNLEYLFKGVKIDSYCTFRILRSAEVYVQSDSYRDQYEMIELTLKEREKSWITMLEVAGTDKQVEMLKALIPVTDNTIVLKVNTLSTVGLSALKKIPKSIFPMKDQARLHEPANPFPSDKKIMDYIKEADRLVFHPFESYRDTFVRFIEEAAENDDLISIKIALYRVADKSRIIDALIRAAENGKQVTVLVELKARFDEGHNIKISRILREAGVRLVYGSPDLKTHAKLCLVTAIQGHKTVIYSHIGTGNYNESNAKQYTDYSYFTADKQTGYDLTRFFNLLTSTQEKFKSKKIFYAPYNLRTEIIEQIENQIKLAKENKPARIIFKCNSLTDDKVSKALTEAANAGVDVTLIIRGACVIPYQPNIKVYSIVGRFLEHSRIYLFGRGKHESIYIGSNDIMYRNLNRRNELMLKVEPKELKDRIKYHLKMYMDDTDNRRTRIGDYEYFWEKDTAFVKRVDCQQQFIREANKREI